MANQLGRCKQYKAHLDLAFLNTSGKKIGEIRIKPNRVLWASKGEKLWRGVQLKEFAKFMSKMGKRQSK